MHFTHVNIGFTQWALHRTLSLPSIIMIIKGNMVGLAQFMEILVNQSIHNRKTIIDMKIQTSKLFVYSMKIKALLPLCDV